jgi:hypothetical protein
VTDSEQEQPVVPAKGTARPRPYRGSMIGVLSMLFDKVDDSVATGYEPDVIRAEVEGGARILVEFTREAIGVIRWAQALDFGEPVNWHDPNLQQVGVQADGQLDGWQVQIRHIHTAGLTIGRPVVRPGQPPAEPTGEVTP